jgi:hypothetical protein
VRRFEISPSAGARTSILLASGDINGTTGEYWVRGKPGHMSRSARSASAAARLWQVSEELLGEAGFPPPPLP